MPAILTLNSNSPTITGFRYVWAKTVRGFNSSVHCANCLKGRYLEEIGRRLKTGSHELLAMDGTIVYLCGVSQPYMWEKNFHAAFRIGGDDTITLKLYTGAEIIIEGVTELPFDDKEARRQFPNKGKSFLTCRNFQFAAQYFPVR